MRFLRIGTYSREGLASFQERGDLSGSYEDRLRRLLADRQAWSDSWTAALRDQGFEGREIVANADFLQSQWAREHGIDVQTPGWRLLVLEGQVREWQPEVVFLVDNSMLGIEDLRRLRAASPGLRLFFGWSGGVDRRAEVLRELDFVLTCSTVIVDELARLGIRAHFIDHAFDARLLSELPPAAPVRPDVVFVGSIVKGAGGHVGREQLLLKLLDRFRLELRLSTHHVPAWGRLLARSRRLAFDAIKAAERLKIPVARLPVAGRISRWPARPGVPTTVAARLRRAAQTPLYGLAMYAKLRDARVCLNTHIDFASHAANQRLFEATGVGTCLVTDWKPDLARLFEPDAEVLTYASPEECVEKIGYLLDNEAERERIARAAQARVLRSHTFAQRAPVLAAIVQDELRRAR